MSNFQGVYLANDIMLKPPLDKNPYQNQARTTKKIPALLSMKDSLFTRDPCNGLLQSPHELGSFNKLNWFNTGCLLRDPYFMVYEIIPI